MRKITFKTIEISDTVYRKFVERKKDDEEISDVIERLMDIDNGQKKLMKSFRILTNLPDEYIEILKTDINETREEINRRYLF